MDDEYYHETQDIKSFYFIYLLNSNSLNIPLPKP